MTQKYQVKVSMKQAAIVETGIVLKQGDFGMQIEIEVLDFDATGTTPQIVFRKAMGAVESTTITVSGNKYTYTFKGTELDTPGKCFCDLKLKNSTTQRISTASFMFKVVADTLDGLAEESSSYSDTIAQLMEDCLHKSETAGFVKNDGTIDTNSYALSSAVNDLTNETNNLKAATNSFAFNENIVYLAETYYNKYIKPDGTEDDHLYLNHTGLIDISDAISITFYAGIPGGGQIYKVYDAIAFYDSNQDFISTSGEPAIAGLNTISPVENAKYIIYNYSSSQVVANQIYLKIEKKSSIDKSIEERVNAIAETQKITFKDFTEAGGITTNNEVFKIIYNDTIIWYRTKRFKVYPGMRLKANISLRVVYFPNDSFITSDVTVVYANSSKIFSSNGYALICVSLPTSEALPSESTVYAEISPEIPKYSESLIWIPEGVNNQNRYASLGISKYYTSNGLSAIGCENVMRGITDAYDGDILYTDHASSNFVFSIAFWPNYDNSFEPAFIGLSLTRGANTGTIYIMRGTGNGTYTPNASLTFTNQFQGNLNGLKCNISNNTLTVSYIYEGEIYTNTASLSNTIFERLYNLFIHKVGCCLQTGTGLNIAFYGKGFTSYDDYYRFTKDLADDGQLVGHEARITALEEGGGGGGGDIPALDWAKGYDLLDFGQEYLYAWLNALHAGNGFKVLFTGDSTTAYYNGTADGLKEIFQSCMTKAGYANGTYVNRAVSGINTSTWRSNYLAGDISENPTLYIIRHGFNNESGETEAEMAENFRTEMAAALTTIRTSLGVNNTSIILMTPNTSDDNENHRGYSMKKLLDPIVRSLAREYGCGFIDTFRIWYDAGTYADPMYDDPFHDGRSIHPNGLMNRVIMSRLFDFAVPIAYRDYSGT